MYNRCENWCLKEAFKIIFFAKIKDVVRGGGVWGGEEGERAVFELGSCVQNYERTPQKETTKNHLGLKKTLQFYQISALI